MTVCVSVRIRINRPPDGAEWSEWADLERAAQIAKRAWLRANERERLGSFVDVGAHDGDDWRGVVVRVNVDELTDELEEALVERAEAVANGAPGFVWDSVDVGDVRPL